MAQIAIGFFVVAAAIIGICSFVAFISQLATRGRCENRPRSQPAALHTGRYSQKPIASAVPKLPASEAAPGKLDTRYVAKAALLSPAERSFFGVLKTVMPAHTLVFPKVRLCDIIEPREQTGRFGWSAYQTALNKVTSKHIDFVLCEAATTKVLCVIELDDRSHQRSDRRTRDSFVNAALEYAGISILRIRAAHTYAPEMLRRELAERGIKPCEFAPPAGDAFWQGAASQDDSRYMPPMTRA